MAIDLKYDTLPNGVTVINLTGTMDALGAQAIDLRFNAISGSQSKIIVNMENVDYLSSMGIRTIIMGAKVVQRNNGKMVIVKPSSDVEKVLSESGVDTLIPIFQEMETAEKLLLE
jgi:anti-sigma B factor antagonist